MKYFKVEHLSAGTFSQGAIVTDEDIAKGGFSLDQWLKVGAVTQTADPNDPPAKQPPVNAAAAQPPVGSIAPK